jgi:hypothetical protein
MEIAIGLMILAACLAALKLHVIGVPEAKERAAHYLLASAAGDRARKAAFAAAMRGTARLEVAGE